MQAGAEETDLLATTPESAPAKEAYLDELERLSDLLDQGVITEDEFTTKKKQILSAQS
jgi:predicted Zn-dependent peptidase